MQVVDIAHLDLDKSVKFMYSVKWIPTPDTFETRLRCVEMLECPKVTAALNKLEVGPISLEAGSQANSPQS